MLLAIDIGNTNVTLGVFEGETLGPRLRLATNTGRTADEYGLAMLDAFRRVGVAVANIHAVALASVVPALTSLFIEGCQNYLNRQPLVVDGAMRTGLRSLYDDPQQLGADRIVDAAAAYKLYGGPVCVIDFGTATTFDAVSADGDFLGGAIAPGIGIAAEALYRRAAKLPKVDLEPPPAAIGGNTRNSLQSGILYGYAGLVDGMVARFRAELGADMKVVATGGLAEIVAAEAGSIGILAPWLMLDGLRIIYELNSQELNPH
ncbi:MAG: type III pantothenate kinase [Acidobacteriota bacterium]|jgi:type III pantothenate kinase|nr:type III pantothenate kinase [Acidobacteriota bacterium]